MNLSTIEVFLKRHPEYTLIVTANPDGGLDASLESTGKDHLPEPARVGDSLVEPLTAMSDVMVFIAAALRKRGVS